MIHNDIQNQLQLLIKTSAPPLIEVTDHAVGTPQWTPGQQIPAHVLASLPNGRFQVQVGDQILDLNLPRNTQPGEQLELTYVSNTPRLTFAMVREAQTPPPANTPVLLSEAAKLIGNLLQGMSVPKQPLPANSSASTTQMLNKPETLLQQGSAQVSLQNQGTQPARINAPLVQAGPPVDVAQFAQALRASVSQSGLFYESHQVQWLNGERSLSALKQEPQGQLPPSHQAEARQPAATIANAAGLEGTQKPTTTSPMPGQSLPVAGESAPAGSGIHPQAVPIVQQQLQALDTRQVIWQGQVWPGQAMEWAIEEELPEHKDRGGEGDATTWHTRLNLQLPTLGGVSAKLAIVNGAVQLDISAEANDSVNLMLQHQTSLAERFSASGLQLSGVTIHHG